MAAKTNRVEVEIVATDEATPTIAKLEKRIDGLESDEARITITANIERLDKQLTDALAKMRDLDGDELTVQARLVGTLEDDLIAANKLFEQLDGKTGTVKIEANTSDLDATVRRVDDIGKSANSSKSALANMIGNTTQDMGELGGVVGSTGVAIGQLAEYAADAAFSGEGLVTVLGNMAKVAGPILVLTTVMGALKAAQEGLVESGKLNAANQERWNEALKEGVDPANAWLEQMRETAEETGKVEVDLTKITGHLQDQSILMQDFSIGRFFDLTPHRKQTEDISEIFESWPGLLGRVSQAVVGTENQQERFRQAIKESSLSVDEQTLVISFLNQQIDAYNTKRADMEGLDDIFGPKATDDTDAQADALEHLNTEMGRYLAFLRERHNAALPEIEDFYRRKTAADAAAESLAKLNIAETEHQQAVEQRRAAPPIVTTEELRNLDDAVEGIHELAESLDEIESGALGKVFDTGNKGVDALTAIQNVNQGLRDLAEFIRDDLEGVIPNTLDPNDINADDFLNKFAAIRGPIQAQLEQTFATLGEQAAMAQAESWVNTIAAQTGIRREEIRNLLGIPDLEVKLHLAVDEADKEKARRLLDILGRFPEGDLRKQANLSLQLELGLISPQNALTILQTEIERELAKDAKKHVEISTVLGIPDNTDEVRAAAERDFTNDPAQLPVVLTLSSAEVSRLQGLMQLALGQNFAIPGGAFPVGNVTNNVYNPPGTPPTIVAGTLAYGRLNGVRRE